MYCQNAACARHKKYCALRKPIKNLCAGQRDERKKCNAILFLLRALAAASVVNYCT